MFTRATASQVGTHGYAGRSFAMVTSHNHRLSAEMDAAYCPRLLTPQQATCIVLAFSISSAQTLRHSNGQPCEPMEPVSNQTLKYSNCVKNPNWHITSLTLYLPLKFYKRGKQVFTGNIHVLVRADAAYSPV